MMTPSIWTQVAAYVGCEDVLDAMPLLCELGWKHFELSTEHLQLIEDAPDREARIERVRALLGELGAAMPQAHAYLDADIAHHQPARRDADVDRLRRNLRTSAALGVRVVVIHPGRGAGCTTRQERRALIECNRRQLGRLGDLAGELGLRIAIENMADSRELPGRRRLGAMPFELLDLIEPLGHPALGVCFDTSHANMQGLDLAACVRELGSHVIATHLSDNDGSGDQHRTPGGGTIDWPAVMAALADVGYDGTANLEIPGEKCASPELMRGKIRHALDVTRWLIGLAAAPREG